MIADVLDCIKRDCSLLFMGVTTNTHLNSVEAAVPRLGIKQPTLRKWIAQRRIGYVRVGRRIFISDDEIARIVQAGTVPALDRTAR
jgi:excisionase family DNA binding protein